MPELNFDTEEPHLRGEGCSPPRFIADAEINESSELTAGRAKKWPRFSLEITDCCARPLFFFNPMTSFFSFFFSLSRTISRTVWKIDRFTGDLDLVCKYLYYEITRMQVEFLGRFNAVYLIGIYNCFYLEKYPIIDYSRV